MFLKPPKSFLDTWKTQILHLYLFWHLKLLWNTRLVVDYLWNTYNCQRVKVYSSGSKSQKEGLAGKSESKMFVTALMWSHRVHAVFLIVCLDSESKCMFKQSMDMYILSGIFHYNFNLIFQPHYYVNLWYYLWQHSFPHYYVFRYW